MSIAYRYTNIKRSWKCCKSTLYEYIPPPHPHTHTTVFFKIVDKMMNTDMLKPKGKPEKVAVKMQLCISTVILCSRRECVNFVLLKWHLHCLTVIPKFGREAVLLWVKIHDVCHKSLLNVLFQYCTPVTLRGVHIYVGVQIHYVSMCCDSPKFSLRWLTRRWIGLKISWKKNLTRQLSVSGFNSKLSGGR
jgi:hypothetical protein